MSSLNVNRDQKRKAKYNPHNKEILSITRPVDSESADGIANVIRELSDDKTIPTTRNIEFYQRLFVLDRYIVGGELRRGFSLGYGSFKAKVEDVHADGSYRDPKSATIKRILLNASANKPKNIILMEIECPEVEAERVAYYGIMNRRGAHLHRKIQKPDSLTIYLGSLYVDQSQESYQNPKIIEKAIYDTLIHKDLGTIQLLDSDVS